VELLSPDHLHWPDLDIDLHVESIDHPERFPLRWPVEAFRRTLAEIRGRAAQPSPATGARPVARPRRRAPRVSATAPRASVSKASSPRTRVAESAGRPGTRSARTR
jgi:hypothetical protein